ncbi:MAG: GatB/YqeY domain-containing protein [Anaerolineales bacterium]|nr:GatB/YqeY domain-containing protein [Anaerolineales bacterium]MDD5466739.1 GatB/YqeY domain-containing protein [Anaerolineales bacterium]
MKSMELKPKLENDLKDAMRANDEVRKRTLRMVLSAIKLAEVDKGKPVDDAALLGILQKEVKMRQEAIGEAERAKRADLAAAAQSELAVLESYLPQPFSEADLEALIKEAIGEAGATSLREMGQVMKTLMPRLQGRATGDQASQVVRKLLS